MLIVFFKKNYPAKLINTTQEKTLKFCGIEYCMNTLSSLLCWSKVDKNSSLVFHQLHLHDTKTGKYKILVAIISDLDQPPHQ